MKFNKFLLSIILTLSIISLSACSKSENKSENSNAVEPDGYVAQEVTNSSKSAGADEEEISKSDDESQEFSETGRNDNKTGTDAALGNIFESITGNIAEKGVNVYENGGNIVPDRESSSQVSGSDKYTQGSTQENYQEDNGKDYSDNSTGTSTGGSGQIRQWYENLDISRCNLSKNDKFLLFEYAYKYKREELIEEGDKEFYKGFKSCMDAIYRYSDKPMQVKAAHDWMATNVLFYPRAENISGIFIAPRWVDNEIGPFQYGEAMQDGYNSAFILCMKIIGVECEIVEGKYDSCPRVTSQEKWPEHEWLNVKLDGAWYHIDLFSEIVYKSNKGEISYQYFNVTDEELSIDHTWIKKRNCNAVKYSYYDFYCKDQNIDAVEQFYNHIINNNTTKEITLVIKNTVLENDLLYNYENVSEHTKKFIIWRIRPIYKRGSYSECLVEVKVQREHIYPEFAHSTSEYYAIANKAMKEHYLNPTIIIADGTFDTIGNRDFDGSYSMEHDGVVSNIRFNNAHFDYSTSNDEKYYAKANAKVKKHVIADLTTYYISEKYAGHMASNTREFAQIVVNDSEDCSYIGYNCYSFLSSVIVKNNAIVESNRAEIEKYMRELCPSAAIIMIMECSIRDGYSEWRISGMK